MLTSYAERHNGVDDIIVVSFQSLDSLLSGDVGLSHDELNVLSFQARVVNFLAVVFLFLLLVLDLWGLALALVRVVVAGVCVSVGSGLGGSELLGCVDLGLGVQVFDLGFTEDANKVSALFLFLHNKCLGICIRTSRCWRKENGRHRAG